MEFATIKEATEVIGSAGALIFSIIAILRSNAQKISSDIQKLANDLNEHILADTKIQSTMVEKQISTVDKLDALQKLNEKQDGKLERILDRTFRMGKE